MEESRTVLYFYEMRPQQLLKRLPLRLQDMHDSWDTLKETSKMFAMTAEEESSLGKWDTTESVIES